jgi:hypothetical protein
MSLKMKAMSFASFCINETVMVMLAIPAFDAAKKS